MLSHERLGNLATDEGNLAAARTSYQAALDIYARLTAPGPRQLTAPSSETAPRRWPQSEPA